MRLPRFFYIPYTDKLDWVAITLVSMLLAMLASVFSGAAGINILPLSEQWIRDCAEHRPLAECRADAKELWP